MEADYHKNKGNMAFKAGKYQSAIMHYSEALDLDHVNPTYYTNLAAAHNALRDYENGLKMALAARKADPSYAKGIYRQAQALQGLGRLREALAAYEEGLMLIPESAQMMDRRKEVSKAIRDAESSELNALAKLKAIKEAEAERQDAVVQLHEGPAQGVLHAEKLAGLSSESPDKVVQVCLSTGRDATFFRRLPWEMPISEVKRLLIEALCSKPNRPPIDVAVGVERLWPESWLSCNGRRLRESSTLKASNVREGETIDLHVCCPPLLL